MDRSATYLNVEDENSSVNEVEKSSQFVIYERIQPFMDVVMAVIAVTLVFPLSSLSSESVCAVYLCNSENYMEKLFCEDSARNQTVRHTLYEICSNRLYADGVKRRELCNSYNESGKATITPFFLLRNQFTLISVFVTCLFRINGKDPLIFHNADNTLSLTKLL